MALMDGHEIGHGLGREKLELFFFPGFGRRHSPPKETKENSHIGLMSKMWRAILRL